VGDIHDADAAPAQRPQPGEQLVALGGGEGGGRLVEDEQAHVLAEPAGDQDELGGGQPERPGAGPRVDPVGVDQRQGRPGLAVQRLAVDHAQPAPPAADRGRPGQEHVAGHVQLGDEGQLLVDGGDAVALGVAAVLEADRLAVDRDGAGVGLVEAGEHLDQGALAGPVLADQRVDLADSHLEVDTTEGRDPGERLGDPLGPQQRNPIVAHQPVPCRAADHLGGRPPR
jgi:hypothetical protein